MTSTEPTSLATSKEVFLRRLATVLRRLLSEEQEQPYPQTSPTPQETSPNGDK